LTSDTEFDFWQDHSIKYLEMALRADRRERPDAPDGYGKRTGDCGDTVEMFITVRDNRLQSVTFDAVGCMNTNACANTVAHLAEGRTVEQAWEITPADVVEFLETLPSHENHCAELAVGAFYLALAKYQEHLKAPWKKAYLKI
jgi:nitrogen fixation NifU-like protein